MLMYFKNIKQPYVLVADIEYDKDNVLQCAGLIIKLVDEKNYIYQLAVNFNWYIKVPSVDKYAIKYNEDKRAGLVGRNKKNVQSKEANA